MVALTKADIAERLNEDVGLSKRESKEMVELFLRKSAGLSKKINR